MPGNFNTTVNPSMKDERLRLEMTTQTVETKKNASAPVAGKQAAADKQAALNKQAAENKQAELTSIMVPVGRIKLGSNSSRMLTKLADDPDTKKLAAEIKEVGLLHNLVVGPMGTDGKYELRAGFRRFEAVKMLGWKEVPVRINMATSARVVNLYENFKRKDISAMEFALSLQAIAAENKWKLPYVDGKPKAKGVYQVAEMAKLLRCSSALITEHCKLLALPPKVQKSVHEGELASRGAFTLVGMGLDEETMAKVLEVAEGLQEKKEEKKKKNKETEKKAATKVTPTSASKETMAAAKREKEAKAKKRVEAATVKAAAAKVGEGKREEAAKAKAKGDVGKAEKLEKEAKSLEKAASKSGGAGRTLGDWTEIVKQVKGEGEGCDDFAKVYEGWLKGEMEDEDVVRYMVQALGNGVDELETE